MNHVVIYVSVPCCMMQFLSSGQYGASNVATESNRVKGLGKTGKLYH